MADQCDACGMFKRRIRTADGGEGWLCLNCNDHAVIAAVSELRDALDVPERGQPTGYPDTAPFAFGLADALADHQATSGHPPQTVAASCLYLGSILAGAKLNQDAITAAADISETVIRQHYRDLYAASGYQEAYGRIEGGELVADEPSPAVRLEEWRSHLESEGKQRTTIKTDVSNVRSFARWYDGHGAPTPADVTGWFDHLVDAGYAPSTIESRFKSIRHYFEWADLATLDIDISEYVSAAWQQKVG